MELEYDANQEEEGYEALGHPIGVSDLSTDETLEGFQAVEEYEKDPENDLRLQVLCLKTIIGNPLLRAEVRKKGYWNIIKDTCIRNNKSVWELKLEDYIPGWGWDLTTIEEQPKTRFEEQFQPYEDLLYEQQQEIKDLKRRIVYLENIILNMNKKQNTSLF